MIFGNERFERLGLIMNPFSPVVAEERPRELFVLVGDEHNGKLQIINSKFEDSLQKKTLNYVVLSGLRGTGKSAIIRAFLETKSNAPDVLLIPFRLNDPSSLTTLFRRFIKSLIHENLWIREELGDRIKRVEKGEISLEELLSLVKEVLSLIVRKRDPRPRVIVITWDQLENLMISTEEMPFLLSFFRSISTLPQELGIGILFIISVVPEWVHRLVKLAGKEEAFIRNVKEGIIEVPSRLSLKDTFKLFQELLNRVRPSKLDQEIEEELRTRRYYPFEENAIKAIYDAADGNPGTIYELASRVLSEAVANPAIKVIDEAFVHDVVLDINPEWYKALSIPPRPLNNILQELLDAAKELGQIHDYHYFAQQFNKYRYILQSFNLRESDDTKSLLSKRVLDFIVIYKYQERLHLVLIKTARTTIRRDTAEAIVYLLNNISGYTYGGASISKDRMRFILISYSGVGKTIYAILKQAAITSGIPVDLIQVNTNSAYIYGRLMHVITRIEGLKGTYLSLRAIPIRSQHTLANDVRDVLNILGIIQGL